MVRQTGRSIALLIALGATALSLLAGCPRTGGKSPATGADEGASWVVFDSVERGSGNYLLTYVWVEGHADDFETVSGGGDTAARFFGMGKTGEGYTVDFQPRLELRLVAWSPGHEMSHCDVVLKRGENVVPIELRKAEVEDDQVPETIRLDVIQRLPTEAPKTGS
jgi:hypothetical protein